MPDPAARARPDLRHHRRRHRPLGRLGDEPRLGAVGAGAPRRVQRRGAAVPARPSSAFSRRSPAPGVVGFVNGDDHRQAEGAGLHRDARHLVHRARRRAADVARTPRSSACRQGIRAYGNEALIYLIRGEGGGLYFLAPPEVSGELLRRMDRILPYPVIVTAVVVGHRDLPAAQDPVRPAHLRDRRQHARRRSAPASRSIATSSRSTCCRRSPPASPASSRRCASPRARR